MSKDSAVSLFDRYYTYRVKVYAEFSSWQEQSWHKFYLSDTFMYINLNTQFANV